MDELVDYEDGELLDDDMFDDYENDYGSELEINDDD